MIEEGPLFPWDWEGGNEEDGFIFLDKAALEIDAGEMTPEDVGTVDECGNS